MKHFVRNLDIINDKTHLLLKFNRASILLSIIFGLFCFYALSIKEVLPLVFFLFAASNLVNLFILKKYGNVTTMAITICIAALISTFVITIFSGGIESPFVFVFAIIILAGYMSTSVLGKIYFYAVLVIVACIFLMDVFHLSVRDVVPPESKKVFSFASILFSVYLLGVVLGRTLLKTHHALYKSKREIEQRINEKEILLREVHHRVKNNLQTVSSLLNMQARDSTNEQIKYIMKSSQNRVVSMAMIHEMLYMHNDLSKIEFKPYVQDLCDYLVKSLNPGLNNVSLKIDIPNIQLGIDTAIPLGLLINEAITNSLKYGFSDNKGGQIQVILKMDEEGEGYVLSIGDDGIGFASDLNPKETKSLGLKLILKLARQLKGSVAKDNSRKGTHYIIAFKDIDIKAKRVA
ncbi:MAG: histidine kinase dimerization/phosphoacceptor domain -containing protein [Bacteroidota bacterium]